jgi:hypothetical protein
MIKQYKFEYNGYDAQVCFKVDTEKFTEEHANATLGFFLWDYDEDANPIDEVMKKYAMKAIKIATFEGYNIFGVKKEFNDLEGFCKVDGSSGIELISVSEYEFDDSFLECEITDNPK